MLNRKDSATKQFISRLFNFLPDLDHLSSVWLVIALSYKVYEIHLTFYLVILVPRMVFINMFSGSIDLFGIYE